ncbi:hypothetical protein CGI81_25005, partial [Vibrio parahaemolyticus]|uniref:hypothetical protein n=1 Tax=Vibrio parahaemolyticus TaxID=670 RepID=UPI00117527BE
SILENISDSTPESLLEFKNLTVKINRIKEDELKLLYQFKEIMDDYFKDTDKKVIIDDENEALVIELSSQENKRINLN